MKAVLIPHNGPPELVEQNGLSDMQELVGGFIESLSIGLEDANAWGHDEAKMVNYEMPDGSWREGMPENKLATQIVYGDKVEAKLRADEQMAAYREMGMEVVEMPQIEGYDEPCVAGPILITGLDRTTGETTEVPDYVIERLVS